MTPSARIQATIELWQKITDAKIPMDNVCGDYFRTRRFIGSKDRAEIAERVYGMMRAYARLHWWSEQAGLDKPSSRHLVLLFLALSEEKSAEDIDQLCNGRQYHPAPLNDKEKSALKKVEGKNLVHKDMPETVKVECPPYAEQPLRELFGDQFNAEMAAMIPPATLDVRVNTLKSSVEDVQNSLAKQDVESVSCPYSPMGLRLTSKAFLSKTKAFTKGLIEIQDEGSQLLALLCGAKPGMQVLDYCAGGGGKTLALANMMENKGRIVAMDIEKRRLDKGKPRYVRAGIHNVETRALDDEKHKKWFRRQKENFDIVLVDAPCTSSGTWRRNPDLRWNTYGPDASAIETVQGEILERVKKAVKPGGRIIYATCSLFLAENERQIERFLTNNDDYELIPVEKAWKDAEISSKCPVNGKYLRLSPLNHQTDGFFAAVLQKK